MSQFEKFVGLSLSKAIKAILSIDFDKPPASEAGGLNPAIVIRMSN